MHEHHISHLIPVIADFGVYIVNAQSKNRHLTANVKGEGDHNTIRDTLSETTDEDERHLQGVRNRVRAHILDRVEQMKAIRQQINYLSHVLVNHYSR